MLVIKIELWPLGDEKRKKNLGRIEIANTGGGRDDTIGSYLVRLFKSPELSKTPGLWRSGKVEGFPRKKLGSYDLIFRALNACKDMARRNPDVQVEELGDEDPFAGIEGL